MMSSRSGCRLVLSVLAASALLAASAARAQTHCPPDFTLPQLLSAPFPSGLTAAPEGGRVAWVYNDRGVRNVWVAERGGAGAYRSRPLTRFTGE